MLLNRLYHIIDELHACDDTSAPKNPAKTSDEDSYVANDARTVHPLAYICHTIASIVMICTAPMLLLLPHEERSINKCTCTSICHPS